VREKSPATTAVGQVIARASSPEQELDYTIMSVRPAVANETFTIGSCSGMILVRDPTLLVYRAFRNFTLTIRVRPNLADASAAWQNITVFVINVDDPVRRPRRVRPRRLSCHRTHRLPPSFPRVRSRCSFPTCSS
jgi:hypothetical protein